MTTFKKEIFIIYSLHWTTIFWDIMLCTLAQRYHFGNTCWPNHQDTLNHYHCCENLKSHTLTVLRLTLWDVVHHFLCTTDELSTTDSYKSHIPNAESGNSHQPNFFGCHWQSGIIAVDTFPFANNLKIESGFNYNNNSQSVLRGKCK